MMNFGEQFWPELVASFTSGLGVLFAAYILIKIVRKPRLCVEAVGKRNSEHHIEVEILLRNIGSVSVERNTAYWHVFVDSRLAIVDCPHRAEMDVEVIHEIGTTHFQGEVDGAVFPHRSYSLLRIIFNRPAFDGAGLYYFLSTSYGMFPSYLGCIKDGEKRQERLPCFAFIERDGVRPANAGSLSYIKRLKLWVGSP